MIVSLVGFSSNPLCWASVEAESPNQATNPTANASHNEWLLKYAALIEMATASVSAVRKLVTNRPINAALFAFLTPVSFVHAGPTVRLSYHAIAMAMPATNASMTPSQLILISMCLFLSVDT